MKLKQKELDILYECWKTGNNLKERMKLATEQIPKVNNLLLLKTMRSLEKNDPKWLRWKTRKTNERQRQKEQARLERAQRREKREQRKIEKEIKTEEDKVKYRLAKHIDIIKKNIADIELKLFYCPDMKHYMSNHACIFRVFSNISFGPICDKCVRMNKYREKLEEIINERPTK